MLAIQLPDSIEERLTLLAIESGRTKSALVSEAIFEYIDDLEDFYLAEARVRENHQAISIVDVERILGL
ncbi:toxin-antitoxin system antitoxin subunit [Chromatium weissei]|nr:toxin-antitoxin system antitoxin subunit [Chromatium weissei]